MKRFFVNKKKNILFWILSSLLIISCLAVLGTGFLLKKGFRLDTLNIGRVLVSGFYLDWQDKLELRIDTITIREQHGAIEEAKDLTFVSNGVKAVHYFGMLFSKITIETIKVGEQTATIHFGREASQEPYYFTLVSKDLEFRSNLVFDQDILVVDIVEAASKRFHSRASGRIRLDTENERISGTLSANLGGSLPVTLDFTADNKQLSFQGKEAGRISTIEPLVDLFNLNPNIQRWITEYLKGSRYNLKTFRGVIPWHDPKIILDTLYAEVRVEDCEYILAPGLEPIKAGYTDITFNKGVLTITPHGTTFKGQEGGGSWLDINFNDPANIILTAYIKTRAKVNDDILNLLNHYKITLPFKQTAGKTSIDLVLAITLNKLKMKARGTFLIDKSVVAYEQRNFGVSSAKITLENNDIFIEHMLVHFEELFVADITGIFKAGSGTGDLTVSMEQLTFKIDESILTLAESGKRPIIDYHIRPDGHSIDFSSSSWKLDAQLLRLGAFSTPFSVNELSVVLPPTLLTIPPGISAKISGPFSIKKKQADFHCDLFQYQVKDLILVGPRVPIIIKYDRELTIRTEKTSNWRLNNIPITIYPSEFTYDANVLSVVNSRINYGDFFDSQVSGSYNNQSKQGAFLLGNLHIKDKNISSLLESSNGIPVEVSGDKGNLVIKVPEIDLEISTDEDKNWSATFNDLAIIHPRSTLLQQYLLEAGSVTISSKNGKKPYNLSAHIPYRYPFLLKDNKPVEDLNISGKITDKGIKATVNEDLQINYTDRLTVTSGDIGYNIPAILKFIKERPQSGSTDSHKKKKLTLSLEANNSYLFFREGNRVLADRIHIEVADGRTLFHLEHGPGSIILEIEGDQLSMEGKELNDTFMSSLIRGTDFQNGRMTMAATGSFDQLSVLFKLNDTIIRDLKPLNNILAFAILFRTLTLPFHLVESMADHFNNISQ